MLQLLNQARQENGVPALCPNRKLTKTANDYSAVLQQRHLFQHDVDGQTVGDRASKNGYQWQTVGENLASESSALDAFQRLMLSPGHRANILSPDFTMVGIGGSSADGDLHTGPWVQVFGQSAGEVCDDGSAQQLSDNARPPLPTPTIFEITTSLVSAATLNSSVLLPVATVTLNPAAAEVVTIITADTTVPSTTTTATLTETPSEAVRIVFITVTPEPIVLKADSIEAPVQNQNGILFETVFTQPTPAPTNNPDHVFTVNSLQPSNQLPANYYFY